MLVDSSVWLKTRSGLVICFYNPDSKNSKKNSGKVYLMGEKCIKF